MGTKQRCQGSFAPAAQREPIVDRCLEPKLERGHLPSVRKRARRPAQQPWDRWGAAKIGGRSTPAQLLAACRRPRGNGGEWDHVEFPQEEQLDRWARQESGGSRSRPSGIASLNAQLRLIAVCFAVRDLRRIRASKLWMLRPQGHLRRFPNLVPATSQQNYQEAAQILHLSHRASATLLRRCLQSIIRDYLGITSSCPR